MKLTSVNIGTSQPIATKSGRTGIFKTPRSGPVPVGRLGLQHDHIADTDNHGGVDQAVYIYGQPDYDWWTEELGEPLLPGTFGENLTISGFESAQSCIGDRFVIGDVILEVTSPRIPCATLAARMGDPGFAKRFLKAARPGVYCRVIATGEVSAGDPAAYTHFDTPRIPVVDMMGNYKNPPPELMRRYLQTPVHHKLREDFQAKLSG